MGKKKLLGIMACIVIFSILVIGITFLVLDNDKLKNGKNILLSCEKKTNKAVCVLKGNVEDYEVSAVSALIEVNGNNQLLSVDVDPSWEGDGEEGVVEVYTDTNKSDTFNIATFEVSLEDNSNNMISIVDVEFYDQEYVAHEIDAISAKIK